MARIELSLLLFQITFAIYAIALPDVVKIGKKSKINCDCNSFKGVFKLH